MKTTTVGRKYIQGACIELLRLRKGRYIVARNGQVQDGRRKLNLTQAAEAIDGMKIRAGQGLDEDTGTVDRSTDGSMSVRWDSLVVTPFSAEEIDNLRGL